MEIMDKIVIVSISRFLLFLLFVLFPSWWYRKYIELWQPEGIHDKQKSGGYE